MPKKTTQIQAAQEQDAPLLALPVENAPVVPHDRNAVPAAMSDGELSTLAKKLAAEYEERLDYYTSWKQRTDFPDRSEQERYELAREPASQQRAENILNYTPSKSLTWLQVEDVFSHNPELFVRKWEQIKAEAEQELKIGLTASDACSTENSPWTRAQYVALRNDFADGYEPRNGIEWNFIDQMASAYTMVLHWQKIMLRWQNVDVSYEKSKWPEQEKLPRLTTFEAVNRAADMIDKFQRMFMRCVRGLLSMRRMPVIVQNAGQVNVGAQQVNVGAQTA